ncbi:cobalamin biosynthesis protein CbiB [Halostagnicola larsenii XH-48]|uniref:Probable cobalamin biosynthesis protein CobD n=1 Tax=Halostagnicola larsenii XH-48 TaxID=797299 RepID=W0JN86_9EURY|nr:adenosylcobinamide-phosphate synthase CbiB [Halostagnicola larsenii]AHG00059.1 cobalamin biosynthesis protein CbiB [Halostagnicola larsenii XH-48]
MPVTTLAALALAVSLDLLVGEPPNRVHPVAWFGRLVGAVDRDWGGSERRQRRIGAIIALALPLGLAVVAGTIVLAATVVAPALGALTAALVLYCSTSLRLLLELSGSVVAATETDLERAREQLRGLAGRDDADLSPAQIRSAATESAAENLSDGFVAAMIPFAVLAPVSLPAAAGVAAWVKGVNTLDSMLGYRSKPIGTASARLDDIVMWIPARITAVCLAVAAADPAALSRARRWARVPSSPNSGWPMATLACARSIRLEKPGAYALNDRPKTALPSVADAERAVATVTIAAGIAVVVAVALAVTIAIVLPTVDTVSLEQMRSGQFDLVETRSNYLSLGKGRI